MLSKHLHSLNKHAPIKKKIMPFNNNPFMSKALRKAIMHRSKLKNIYNNYRTEDNWANYKKQRNFCVNLLRKTKTEYFQKLNVKDLSDNIKFWKTIKPFFSNKGLNTNKLMLKESNRLITERSSRPEEFCKNGVLRPATLFKKRLWQRCFPVNFVKFLRTPFL